VFDLSGDVSESEPSDAETIDSESSEDECDDSDVSASETEQTTEPEEEVVPKSLNENFSSECASAGEVTDNDANSLNNGSSSTAEHDQKVRLLTDDRPEQRARGSRRAAVEVLESYAISAQLASLDRSCTSLDGAVHHSSIVTSNAGDSTTASVAAIEGLESYTDSAQPASVDRSCILLEGAVHQTSMVTSSAVDSSSESVGANTPSLRCSSEQPADVTVQTKCGTSAVGKTGVQYSVQHSAAQVNDSGSTTSTACSVRSRRIITTFCGSVGTPASVTQEPMVKVQPELSEQAMNATFTVAHDGDDVSEVGTVCSLSVLDRHHNSTYSLTAAGPSISETFTVTDVSKHHRSVDLKPSLGKSVVIADLGPSTTSGQRSFEAVVPTHQRESVKTFNTFHQMHGIDASRLPPSKQLEVVHSQRRSPAYVLHQAAATKKTWSTFLEERVLTTACPVSADVDSARSTVGSPKTSCWNIPCCNHPTYSTPSSPLSTEVLASMKAAKRCQLPDCGSTVGKERIISATGKLDPVPVLPEVSGLTKMVKNSQFPGCHKFATEYSRHRTPVVCNQYKASGSDTHSQSSSLGFSCSDSNHNARESESVCDTGLGSAGADSNTVVEKSSQRRLRGFATSTPLRDCSPPPPDTSFCSLSSISLVSDFEDCDAAENTDAEVESEDDLILLDVAFALDSSPASSLSTISPNPIQLTTSPNPIGSKLQRLSHKPGGGARRKSSQRLSLPASTNNFTKPHSSRFTSSRDRIKTKCSELSSGIGSVVRSVRSKRTRCEVSSSSSSSDSDDRTLVKKDSHTLRPTRARLSETAETVDISSCDGPSHCTKAICFRCHCT